MSKQLRLKIRRKLSFELHYICVSRGIIIALSEDVEDTKGVIRIRKSKDRQHNGQKKKNKRSNNDLQNIHIKLKIK